MLYANDENSILKTNSKSNRRKPFEDSFEADNGMEIKITLS